MQTESAGHSRPLDGLRFFAFLLVFLHHAFMGHWLGPAPFVRFGVLGVHLFFVLSGFLIGRILLDLKARSDLSFGFKLGRFYVRRALRIFPVYYLVLLLLAAIRATNILPSLGPMKLGIDALYLTNFYIFRHPGSVTEAHFWSLCIEEHFYLLAPLAVLLLSRRALSIVLVSIFVLNAIARGYLHLNWTPDPYWILSPMHFDTLGVGI